MRKFLYVILLFSISGCSVGMAMSGKEDPNFAAFRVGSTRGEVELQLGKPISSVTTSEGMRVDLYEYEIGNKPDATRAIYYVVLDALTVGIWEIAGTIIESSIGEKKRMTITYDKKDRVEAINQAPMPKDEDAKEAKKD